MFVLLKDQDQGLRKVLWYCSLILKRRFKQVGVLPEITKVCNPSLSFFLLDMSKPRWPPSWPRLGKLSTSASSTTKTRLCGSLEKTSLSQIGALDNQVQTNKTHSNWYLHLIFSFRNQVWLQIGHFWWNLSRHVPRSTGDTYLGLSPEANTA